MAIKIYHNPHCSKSRATLQLLRDNGVEPEICEYLKEPPTVSELKDILVRLEMNAIDLVRKQESVFTQFKVDPEKLEPDALLQFMVENPIVIERPIVVRGQKAVIGRPPENVLELV